MDEIIEINPKRLTYLLELFDLSKEDLMEKLNEGGEKHLNEIYVSSQTLELSVLRRIDKLFQQGLSYYTNPVNFSKDEKASIFFRKESFNAELNFADRLKVSQIEDERDHLEVLAVLSDYPKFERNPQLEAFQDELPEDVAKDMGGKLYPQEPSPDQRKFLEQLINKLAECGILVFEYTETWNQINRTSIDGFFISPNVIAIKRQQQGFTREIFTLAHELAHHLLDSEELDKLFDETETHSKNDVEYWCNAFAFAFLVPEECRTRLYEEENLDINSEIIKDLVEKHHISRLAIFTHLALEERIAWQRQRDVKKELGTRYKKSKEEQRKENEMKKELAEEQGEELGFGVARPIHSELEKDIYRNAYIDGVIDEYEVLNKFRPKDIGSFVHV